MKVAWDLLGDSFCTVLVPSLQLFGLRALLHSLGRTEMLLSPNTLWFPGDGILFVLGVQLCRDLLPAPHFKHFSWAELTIMLVLSNIENVQYEKMKKRCGATCKSWRWTSLGKAGSGSTSITSHAHPHLQEYQNHIIWSPGPTTGQMQPCSPGEGSPTPSHPSW